MVGFKEYLPLILVKFSYINAQLHCGMLKWVLLFGISVLCACNGNEPPLTETLADLSKMSGPLLRAKIYSVEGRGFGFDILRNGRPYIHQPFLPCTEGRLYCQTESMAHRIASLMLQRLSTGNFRYLINSNDIDSHTGLNKSEAIKKGITSGKDNRSEVDSFNRQDGAPCLQSVVQYLPALPDMPLKNAWHALMPLPFGKKAGLQSFTIGACIYLGGGMQWEEPNDDFWAYDTEAESWTCLASLPGGHRVSGIAFAVNGNGYLGWGALSKDGNAGFASDLYEYRPAENRWLKKRDLPAPARKDASVFVINNCAYAGLGYANHYLNDFYRYDALRDHWTRCADFPGGELSGALGVSDGKKGYIIAGNHVPQVHHFVYEFDAAANQWIQQPDIPGPARYYAAGAAPDTGLIMAGAGAGEGGELQYRDFYAYHTSSKKWELLANYPVGRQGNAQMVAASVNGSVYMGGGYNGSYLGGWYAYEYYYNVNTETGSYSEEAATRLSGNDHWTLFQECGKENCFVAMAFRSKNTGVPVYYQRLLLDTTEEMSASAALPLKASWVLPRRFALKTRYGRPEGGRLRFFYTAREIEKALCNGGQKKAGQYSLQDCRLLVYQCEEPDLRWENNRPDKGRWQSLQPSWYRYGPAGQILVAEISTASITGEYYLILPHR